MLGRPVHFVDAKTDEDDQHAEDRLRRAAETGGDSNRSRSNLNRQQRRGIMQQSVTEVRSIFSSTISAAERSISR